MQHVGNYASSVWGHSVFMIRMDDICYICKYNSTHTWMPDPIHVYLHIYIYILYKYIYSRYIHHVIYASHIPPACKNLWHWSRGFTPCTAWTASRSGCGHYNAPRRGQWCCRKRWIASMVSNQKMLVYWVSHDVILPIIYLSFEVP